MICDNDNDGILDSEDLDDDNDGIPDLGPDGIAGTDDDDDINVFGNNNYVDPNDLDGDGILNQFDDDIDGDGIENQFDGDVDGDGIINDDDLDFNPAGDDDPTGDSDSDGGLGIGGPSLPPGFGDGSIIDDDGTIIIFVDPITGEMIDCGLTPDHPGCNGDLGPS